MKAQYAVGIVTKRSHGVVGPFASKEGAKAWVSNYMKEAIEYGSVVTVYAMIHPLDMAMEIDATRAGLNDYASKAALN